MQREKGRSFKEERGIGLAEFWSAIEDEMKAELGGTGFWIGNAKLSPEETVDVILANRERARLA